MVCAASSEAGKALFVHTASHLCRRAYIAFAFISFLWSPVFRHFLPRPMVVHTEQKSYPGTWKLPFSTTGAVGCTRWPGLVTVYRFIVISVLLLYLVHTCLGFRYHRSVQSPADGSGTFIFLHLLKPGQGHGGHQFIDHLIFSCLHLHTGPEDRQDLM